MNSEQRMQLDRDGFVVLDSIIPRRELCTVAESVSKVMSARKGGFALRHLLRDVPEVCGFARSASLMRIVDEVQGKGARAIRGIYFDKNPDANWKVAWHQDLTISVREKKEVPGFGPWSLRDGINHVQPPASVLDGILTVRVHIDRCEEENGALRVIPGTHRNGKLNDDCIRAEVESRASVTCEVEPGGLLLMRPLLLHASSESSQPSTRRVVHLEYSACELPDGLEWATT